MSEALDEATRLLSEIGAVMLAGPGDGDLEWVAASVVSVQYGQGASRMHGYLYAADGTWTPGVPPRDLPFDLMRELADATTRPDGERWKAALFHIDRAAGKLTTQFEWDDPDRWKVTPFNFRIMPDQLKPPCVTWPLKEIDAPSIKGGWGEPSKLN